MTNTTVAAMNAGAEASYVLAVITELLPDNLPVTRVFLTMPTQSRTYADSGTTDHCFANREDFTTYLTYNPPHTGHTANKDGTFRILGVDKVKCTFTYNGRRTHFTFKAAVHTPDLSANLISVSKFDDLGFYTTFGGGKVIFLDMSKQVMMEGRRVGGMYLLDMGSPPTAPSPGGTMVMSVCSHEKPVEIDTWHRRLGHAGISTISEMSRKGMVEGLSITRDMNIPGQCEDCILGKHAARPYDEEVILEEDILEHIHIDMWGPASVRSVGGALYLMVLVDGGSAMKFGYPLSHKTEELTLQVFSEFHVAAEHVTGKRLLKVQIDGGMRNGTITCDNMGSPEIPT